MANPAVWVLIRGLVREQRHWGNFPETLQDYHPDDRILMLEVPGNGMRYRETSPISISAMVDSLRGQLAQLDVTIPVRLIGLSMGGMIATCWLQKHPEEIESAVLINTSMRPFNRIDQRLKPQQYRRILSALMATAEQRESIIHDMTVNLNSERTERLGQWSSWAKEAPVTPFNAVRQLIAAARYRADPVVPKNIPLLLLTSLGDRLVSWRCSKAIAERWRCPVFTHPDAGHDLPLDDPHWIITQVNLWLYPQMRPNRRLPNQTIGT